jgi:alpha-1,2-mannosyltransferase
MTHMSGDDARRTISRKAVAVTATLVCGIFVATVARDIVVNDVLSASLGSWRIATTGHPWFDGFPLDQIPRAPEQELWTGIAGNGHVVVFRSPGAIAVGVPAYLAAGRGTQAQDFSVLPGAFTAAFMASATLWLLWGAIRRCQSDADAAVCVLALAFTTPMWSVNANSLWTHSLTVFGIGGMSWAASRDRWWLVGVFGGLGLWGRLHVALIVVIVGLGLAVWRRRPAIALSVGTTSVVFLVGAAAWSRWMYGSWDPQGGYPTGGTYVERSVNSHLWSQVVNQSGLWISPDRGMLVWTPMLVLLLPALVRSWRALPDWTRVLAVAGVAYSLVQGQLNGFTGGSTFYGYRLTLECLACFFPAAALSVRQMGRIAKVLTGPTLGLQLAAISIGAISESFFLLPDRAWYDNSFALALRTVPTLWIWVGLCVLVGYLGGRVWRDRGLGVASTPS